MRRGSGTVRSPSRGRAGWLLAAYLLNSAAAWGEQASTPAERCPEPPAREAVGAAKAAFREGQLAFNEGDYARAVELWQFAYEKDCSAHALLLNLATAQELAGQPGAAAESLRLFNERVPDSDYRLPNERRIERLDQSQNAAAAAAASAPAQPGLPPMPGALAPAPSAAGPERAARVAAQLPAASDGAQRSLVPLGVAAVGAAAGVLGGILYVGALFDIDAAEQRCDGARSACVDPRAVVDGEAARARAQAAGWVTGAGLITATGGMLWYFLQVPRAPTAAKLEGSAAVRWELVAVPGAAGAGMRGTF